MSLQNFLIENPGIVDSFTFAIHFLIMYAGFLILLISLYRRNKGRIKKYCAFVALQTSAYCFLFPEIQRLIMIRFPSPIICWLIGLILMVIFGAAIYYVFRHNAAFTKQLLLILCIQTICGAVLYELADKLLYIFFSFLIQF